MLGDFCLFVCLLLLFFIFVDNVLNELVMFSGVPCHVTLACMYLKLVYATQLHTDTHVMEHPTPMSVKL